MVGCIDRCNDMKLYAIRYAENFKYGTYDSVYRNIAEKGKWIEKFAFLYYLAEYIGRNGYRYHFMMEKS